MPNQLRGRNILFCMTECARPRSSPPVFACERLTRWAGGTEDPWSTAMLDAGVNLRDVQIAASVTVFGGQAHRPLQVLVLKGSL
jgi:hypothetical protein